MIEKTGKSRWCRSPPVERARCRRPSRDDIRGWGKTLEKAKKVRPTVEGVQGLAILARGPISFQRCVVRCFCYPGNSLSGSSVGGTFPGGVTTANDPVGGEARPGNSLSGSSVGGPRPGGPPTEGDRRGDDRRRVFCWEPKDLPSAVSESAGVETSTDGWLAANSLSLPP